MKLLLTSSGLRNKNTADFFLSLFPIELKDCSVLMLSYAQNTEEQSYIDTSKQELEGLGIDKITTLSLEGDMWGSDRKYDIIYVCVEEIRLQF